MSEEQTEPYQEMWNESVRECEDALSDLDEKILALRCTKLDSDYLTSKLNYLLAMLNEAYRFGEEEESE